MSFFGTTYFKCLNKFAVDCISTNCRNMNIDQRCLISGTNDMLYTYFFYKLCITFQPIRDKTLICQGEYILATYFKIVKPWREEIRGRSNCRRRAVFIDIFLYRHCNFSLYEHETFIDS